MKDLKTWVDANNQLNKTAEQLLNEYKSHYDQYLNKKVLNNDGTFNKRVKIDFNFQREENGYSFDGWQEQMYGSIRLNVRIRYKTENTYSYITKTVYAYKYRHYNYQPLESNTLYEETIQNDFQQYNLQELKDLQKQYEDAKKLKDDIIDKIPGEAREILNIRR